MCQWWPTNKDTYAIGTDDLRESRNSVLLAGFNDNDDDDDDFSVCMRETILDNFYKFPEAASPRIYSTETYLT